MPFAWTAIWLQNIIKGGRELGDSGGSDAESTASNSLDRKTSTSSFEQSLCLVDLHSMAPPVYLLATEATEAAIKIATDALENILNVKLSVSIPSKEKWDDIAFSISEAIWKILWL